MLHPNALFTVKFAKEVVDDEKTWRVVSFLMIFILLYVFGVILFAISGCSLQESMFNCISALGNSGPSIGSAGPSMTFSEATPMAKWVMSSFMLIGRLEIFTVLILVMKIFRGKRM